MSVPPFFLFSPLRPFSLSLALWFWRERRALARRHSRKVTRPLERKKRTRSTSSPRIVFEPVVSALCPRESSTAVKHPGPAVSPRQPFATFFFKVIFCSPRDVLHLRERESSGIFFTNGIFIRAAVSIFSRLQNVNCCTPFESFRKLLFYDEENFE